MKKLGISNIIIFLVISICSILLPIKGSEYIFNIGFCAWISQQILYLIFSIKKFKHEKETKKTNKFYKIVSLIILIGLPLTMLLLLHLPYNLSGWDRLMPLIICIPLVIVFWVCMLIFLITQKKSTDIYIKLDRNNKSIKKKSVLLTILSCLWVLLAIILLIKMQ